MVQTDNILIVKAGTITDRNHKDVTVTDEQIKLYKAIIDIANSQPGTVISMPSVDGVLLNNYVKSPFINNSLSNIAKLNAAESQLKDIQVYMDGYLPLTGGWVKGVLNIGSDPNGGASTIFANTYTKFSDRNNIYIGNTDSTPVYTYGNSGNATYTFSQNTIIGSSTDTSKSLVYNKTDGSFIFGSSTSIAFNSRPTINTSPVLSADQMNGCYHFTYEADNSVIVPWGGVNQQFSDDFIDGRLYYTGLMNDISTLTFPVIDQQNASLISGRTFTILNNDDNGHSLIFTLEDTTLYTIYENGNVTSSTTITYLHPKTFKILYQYTDTNYSIGFVVV